MIGKSRIFIVLILFACTWFALQSSSEVKIVPIVKTLSKIPVTIGTYRLADSFQSSSEVLELLGVDDYIQYNYLDENRNRVNLYAGYYSAVGVTGSYHSPKNCLPGGGWGIDSVTKVTLKPWLVGNTEAKVSQMVIRNGSDFQIVLYWYQNRGRIIASEYMEKVYLVLDAISKGRRDGTFVRVMTIARDGDINAAAQRAHKFAEKVIPILADHLPGAEI